MSRTDDLRPAQTGQIALAAAVMAVLAVVHGIIDSAPVAAVALFGCAWRGVGLLRPRWVGLPALLVVGIAGVGALTIEGSADGYGPLAVRSLLILAGLKVLETRTVRDIYLVALLGFFVLATLFLRDQSMGMGLLALTAVIALSSLMVWINSATPRFSVRRTLAQSLYLLVLALPVAGVLFLVFPRLAGPLWHFGLDKQAGVTGLSDTMTPGAINQLVLSEEIAFRVIFDDAVPTREDLYWRGPVLWHTDGRRWTRGTSRQTLEGRTADGPATDYRLILEPSDQRWVLALEHPVAVPAELTLNTDLELLAPQPHRQRTDYRLSSVTGPAGTTLEPRQRTAGLQLPDNITARMRALAGGWRQSAASSDRAVVQAALDHFRRDGFVYTLQPPLTGTNPVDAFLFDTRQGFCEHYSSAFVTLMRIAGVPARVVTGYLGGEINPLNDQLVVRQAEAHAWAEVWLADAGWIRVDPTAAIAPDRVRLGLDVAAAVDRGGRPLFGPPRAFWRSLARQAQWLFDTVEMAWYTGVVNFNDRRQQDLLERLGLQSLSHYGLALAIAALVLAVLGLTWTLLLLERPGMGRAEPAARWYARFRGKIRRKGIPADDREGPLDLARRLSGLLEPDDAKLAAEIARDYIEIRYGPGDNPKILARLRDRIRRFRPRLLTDTKARKDLAEQVVRSKGAGNL